MAYPEWYYQKVYYPRPQTYVLLKMVRNSYRASYHARTIAVGSDEFIMEMYRLFTGIKWPGEKAYKERKS